MNNDSGFYKSIGNLVLNDRQISILKKHLKKHNISIENFNNNHELIYYLEDILNNSYDEELEYVSSELSDMYYYNDVNK